MPNLSYTLPIDESGIALLGVVTRKGKIIIEPIDKPTVAVTGPIDAALTPDGAKLAFLAAPGATEGATGVITVANGELEALVITVAFGAALPDLPVGITADLANVALTPIQPSASPAPPAPSA